MLLSIASSKDVWIAKMWEQIMEGARWNLGSQERSTIGN